MTGRDGGTPTDNGPLSLMADSVSESLGKVKGEISIAGSSEVCEMSVLNYKRYGVFTVAMFKIRSYHIPSWWSTGR